MVTAKPYRLFLLRISFILPLVLYCSLDRANANDRGDAQTQGHDLDEGTRVRIETAHADKITGYVEEITVDALLIRLDEGSRALVVPLAELRTLELSNGRRGRGEAAWSKAKWGALLGAVPGAIALGFAHEQVGESGSSVGKAAALGAWSGGLFGGLIGAVIGASHPGEQWELIAPTIQIGPSGPGGTGFAMAVTIGF